ncbi:MAG: hypothetical protein UT33_C0005G0161 [Candidatus Peregrinibacteria bacterium GW2011_GWC2_39_14]|nr:MAG: hypothetical protein US92_C0001G0162 [Candidatus Peregrinibacteria bacterium GW2011_GWA2_38_36]KKR07217.1 MAG: hypothetical protein UT33_C0005G0161 [Candidatus Peregrinibacteria bacterium GW2011_GWC2_39_14]
MDERDKLSCDGGRDNDKGGNGRSDSSRPDYFARLRALTTPFRKSLVASAQPEYADVDRCAREPNKLAQIALSNALIEKRRRAVELLGSLLDTGELSAIKFLRQIADPNKLITDARYCPKIHDMARKVLDKHGVPWKNCTILTDFRGERGRIKIPGER